MHPGRRGLARSVRREVHRDGRYIRLTRKEFAVLHELMNAARGRDLAPKPCSSVPGIENTDPFTNAVRVTVSNLRKRLGEPPVITTVTGVGYAFGLEPS